VVLSFVYPPEHIGRGAELVRLEVDEIGTGITRVDGLILQKFFNLVDARTAKAIHDVNIIADIDVMEKAPTQVVVCHQTDVAVL